LYGAIKSGKFTPIYDVKMFEDYSKKPGYEMRRFKGLGEMSAYMMRQVMDSGTEYVIKYPKNAKMVDKLIKIIVDSSEKRKYLGMVEEYNFEKFIQNVFQELTTK